MLIRDRERAAARHGWRPTRKQAAVGLGIVALIGLAILLKEPPPVADIAALIGPRDEDEGSRKPPRDQRPRKRRFTRLRRWWRGGDHDYEDVVVRPDER
jgi:hypothetical protein